MQMAGNTIDEDDVMNTLMTAELHSDTWYLPSPRPCWESLPGTSSVSRSWATGCWKSCVERGVAVYRQADVRGTALRRGGT